MIYLDNQTLQLPSKKVIDAVVSGMQVHPFSSHAPYTNYQNDLSALYTLVGASPNDHCLFMNSGAEAISNVVMNTYIDETRRSGKHHFLTSSCAEAPTLLSMMRLQELGCHTQTVDEVSVEAFAEAITPRTALISLSWANGVTGVIHPIGEIGKLCRERNIALHVDATHVLGKGHFLFSQIDADFLTFNGEQIGGPKGSGALFIREGGELSALIYGNDLNHPLLEALSLAAHKTHEMSDHLCMETVRLRNLFEKLICEKLVDTEICFRDKKRLPSITTLAFAGVTTDALAFSLMRRKVFANMGGGLFQQISHFLKGEKRHSALSFALCATTSEEQIEMGARQVIECVQRLKKYSEAMYE